MVKNPPANAGDTEMQIRFLGQEDSPGAGNGNPSSIMGGYSLWGHKESNRTEGLSTHNWSQRCPAL